MKNTLLLTLLQFFGFFRFDGKNPDFYSPFKGVGESEKTEFSKIGQSFPGRVRRVYSSSFS